MNTSQRRLSVVHVLIDVALLSAILVLTTVIRWDFSDLLTASSFHIGIPIALGVVAYLGWVGLYSRVSHHRLRSALLAVGRAVLTGTAAFSLLGFFVAIGGGARRWVVTVALLSWLLLSLHHGIRAAFFATKRRVLVAGSPTRAAAMTTLLRNDRHNAYEVVGFVIDEDLPTEQIRETDDALGTIEELPAIVDVLEIDQVMFSLEGFTGGKFAPMAQLLNRQGVDVGLTDLGSVAPRRVDVRHIEGKPIIEISPTVLFGWRIQVKRLGDVALAGLALIIFGPLMAMVALAIRVVDGVSPIFRQPRVGKDGVLFTIFKFQTMVDGADALKLDLTNELEGPIFKMEADPRITKLGAVLRKTSIDELPQLWNVLRGDMSLVGPRPFVESEMIAAPESFLHRHVVTPGMTGHWQVSGRSDVDFDGLEELDQWYVDNWSLTEDLGILAKTVPAVLRQKGAR